MIAYKQMRKIEAEINRRRGEPIIGTEISLKNFRGIELRDFPAEIARLALIIAEFQCDVQYRGPLVARAEFLPLDTMNWITCGNALRLDWLSVCPPTGTGVKLVSDDLFQTPLEQAQIDFENEGGETYICGNPPYKGSQSQSDLQKDHLRGVFDGRTINWKSLDYVAGWFMKAADYGRWTSSAGAFVSTNSICQGRQVETLWSLILLLRSLQRALYKDEAGRRLTEPNAGPLFSETWEEEDVESGTIYVLRSLSEHPYVAEHRELIHKIGVTGGNVEARISHASHDATYLLAEVEVVATYKLAGINRTKLENLLHRIFLPAQLDLEIQDRFGHPVHPREWFLVPLQVIDEAVSRIRDGSIADVVYDPQSARLAED